jgi:uncharacterized integral membrane protein
MNIFGFITIDAIIGLFAFALTGLLFGHLLGLLKSFILRY